MAQLYRVIAILDVERQRIQTNLERVTRALAALNEVGTKALVGSKRRTMSASARARIAAAQRARWAKWKRAKKK